MINRIAATWGAATAMCLFLFVVLFLTFGPGLILKYAPPFTDFDPGEYSFDADGALLFSPTFIKHWCEYQDGRASWHTVTDGRSDRVSLSFPNEATGDPNRPPGPQKASLWKVDVYAQENATQHFGAITHKCLGFLIVQTIVGPWDIPERPAQ